MVTRRGYLGSTGGFADGFTQGFGLLNQAFNDKRKLDAAEEELQYRRGIDAQESDYRRLDREEDARQFDARLEADTQFRTDEAERQAEEARLTAEYRASEAERDAEEARLTAEYRTSESEANSLVRQAQLSAARVKERDAQEQIDLRAKEARELDAQNAIYQMDQVIKTAQRNGVQPDLATIQDLLKRTETTQFDLTIALGKDYQNNIANLTNTLSAQLNNGEFAGDDIRVEMGADALVNSGEGAMIGQTVDETFVNAPEEFRDGTWRVIRREATDIGIEEESLNQQGPPQLMASMDVLVTVENDKGEIGHYQAPMTEGRTSAASQRTQIPVTDLFDGMGGTAVFIDYLNKNMAEPIKRAKIEKMGGDAKFQEAIATVQTEIAETLSLAPSANTFLSNMTNEEILNSPEDLRRLAEDRVLGLGAKQESFRADAKQELLQTKLDLGPLLKNFRVADSDGNPTEIPKLTNAEIFQLSATLSGDGDVTGATRQRLRDILKKYGVAEIRRTATGVSGISRLRYPSVTIRD